MKNNLRKFGLTILLVSSLNAYEFEPIGARQLGVGNSFTAVGETPIGSIYNPAFLPADEFEFQLPVGFGYETVGPIFDLIAKISDLADEYNTIQKAQSEGTAISLKEIKAISEALNELYEFTLQPAKGVIIGTGGGVVIKFDKFSFALINNTAVSAEPNIDLTNIWLGSGTFKSSSWLMTNSDFEGIDLSKLITELNVSTDAPPTSSLQDASSDLSSTIQDLADLAGVELGGYTPQQISNALINYAYQEGISEQEIIETVNRIKELEPVLHDLFKQVESGNTYSENETNITLKGLSLFQLCFYYSDEIPRLEFLEGLRFGIGLKLMYGEAGYIKQYLLKGEASQGGAILYDYRKYIEKTLTLGLDLGLLYLKPDLRDLRVGLVMRNLNSPKFKLPNEAERDIVLSPQITLGASIQPTPWLLVSSDIDLTGRKTLITAHHYQNISLGCEANIYEFFSIRAGMIKNMASHLGPSYTFGIGFGVPHFSFDLATCIHSTTETIEGVSIPVKVLAVMTLGVKI